MEKCLFEFAPNKKIMVPKHKYIDSVLVLIDITENSI